MSFVCPIWGTQSSEKHQKETGTQILIENVFNKDIISGYMMYAEESVSDFMYGVNFSCLVHHGSLWP